MAQATIDDERSARVAASRHWGGAGGGDGGVVRLAVIGNQLCSKVHLLPSAASYNEYFVEVRTMSSKHQVVKRYSQFVELDARLRGDYPDVDFKVRASKCVHSP